VHRVVIYGSSGSGKSALAAHLADLGLAPHVEIDVLAFEEGVHVDQAVLRERFSRAIAGDTWVVEGMHRDQFEMAIPRADVFVWLDLPRRVIAYRLVLRTLRHAAWRRPRHGRRISLGSLVRREVPFIVKSVRSVPRRQAYARRLVALAERSDVEVLRLVSSTDAERWRRQVQARRSDTP
jgi:nicotinamide riboside kinase